MLSTRGYCGILVVWIWSTSHLFHVVSGACSKDQFTCANNKCIIRNYFCDGGNDCSDGSDERFCSIMDGFGSYYGDPHYDFFSCINGKRIPEIWECDGTPDCSEAEDEQNCEIIPGMNSAFQKAALWIVQEVRKTNALNDGCDLPRIAISLFLADKNFFSSGNSTGEYISNEVTVQLLGTLLRNETEKVEIQKLALFLHALLAICVNPRDFFGRDIVALVRQEVNMQSNYTSPVVLLALCNAGDTMTEKDVAKLTSLVEESGNPSWTDTQAFGVMALLCIQNSHPELLSKKSDIISSLGENLKKHQAADGSIANIYTTGLVVQALAGLQDYGTDTLWKEAITYLMTQQKTDGSFGNLMNTYSVFPVFGFTSLRNVTLARCSNSWNNQTLDKLRKMDAKNGHPHVTYTLWFDDKVGFSLTLNFIMKSESTFLDVMNAAAAIDNNYRFEYSNTSNHIYVHTLSGVQNDPENDKLWFLYKLNANKSVELVTISLSDIRLKNEEKYIMWYRSSPWSEKPNIPEHIAFLERDKRHLQAQIKHILQ